MKAKRAATYEGKPHVCGNTTRYKHGWKCVACASKYQSAYREKNREDIRLKKKLRGMTTEERAGITG